MAGRHKTIRIDVAAANADAAAAAHHPVIGSDSIAIGQHRIKRLVGQQQLLSMNGRQVLLQVALEFRAMRAVAAAEHQLLAALPAHVVDHVLPVLVATIADRTAGNRFTTANAAAAAAVIAAGKCLSSVGRSLLVPLSPLMRRRVSMGYKMAREGDEEERQTDTK